LVLFCTCVNYVVKIWSLTSWIDVDDVFPWKIEEILCDPAYDTDNDFDENDEQSSSDNDN